MTTRIKRGVYGPEERKKQLIVFLDDVNMPFKDNYDAQPPLELIRQSINHKSWYDKTTREVKYFE